MKINGGSYYAAPIKPNFKASLLTQMMQNYATQNAVAVQNTKSPVNAAYLPVSTPSADNYNRTYAQGSLMTLLLNKTQGKNIPAPVGVSTESVSQPLHYKNNLRSMFQNNQAVIYAMIPRTFNAKDTNGNGLIDKNEEPGYFTNMVERLDELKTYGINTLHWLPINPPGQLAAKGSAGSVYAPMDYLSIDPKLDDPRNPKSVYEEAKDAINECHKRGIKVMVDLPSCMSVDLYESRPDLRATDAEGKPKTPEGWEDIRMFNPWEDKDKKILNKALFDYHKKFIDMCIDLGIDGIRADVGRAKPPEFWDHLISYARSKDPEFAFLAECYTYEDASPMKNMPADRPEEALEAGFDSYYGQYHIFHMWKAKDFHKFVEDNLLMSYRHNKGKSLIGSFATHDDHSPMSNGGPDYCMMTNVIQTTVPMTNPYIVTGYESGDRYIYEYGSKYVNKTFNELLENASYQRTVDCILNSVDFKKNLPQLLNTTKPVLQLKQDNKYGNNINFLFSFSNKIPEYIEQNPDATFQQLYSQSEFQNIFGYIDSIASKNFNIKQLMDSPQARNMTVEQLAADPKFKDVVEFFKEYKLTKDNITYYTSPEHVDIFNEAAKPGGEHPEIGQHFGYLMNCVRPRYGELITKGSYIELKVDNNNRDEVIAYARCKDGKTLVTIANHDVNARQKVKVNIPGLKSTQKLEDLSPKYGTGSTWTAKNNAIEIDLGPAQAHIFEVDVPDLEARMQNSGKEFYQNL